MTSAYAKHCVEKGTRDWFVKRHDILVFGSFPKIINVLGRRRVLQSLKQYLNTRYIDKERQSDAFEEVLSHRFQHCPRLHFLAEFLIYQLERPFLPFLFRLCNDTYIVIHI